MCARLPPRRWTNLSQSYWFEPPRLQKLSAKRKKQEKKIEILQKLNTLLLKNKNYMIQFSFSPGLSQFFKRKE